MIGNLKIKIVSYILSFACFTIPVCAMTPSSQPVYKGVDLSSWEPNFDFTLASQQGINVVYLRTSLGRNDKDKSFRKQIQAAQAVGIKVGGYHFLYLDDNYWTWQNNLSNALQAVDGIKFDCKYVIDFEQEGLKDTSLSKEEITADVLNFAKEFTAKTGVPCMLYASTSFINEHFTSDIQQLPIWIADYRNPPRLDQNGLYNAWAGFQYTDKAAISNSPEVDADYFTSDVLLDDMNIPQTITIPDSDKSQQSVSSPLIRYGDTGNGVKDVQTKLNKFGYGLKVDGIFGHATYHAVIDLQKSNGLSDDGIVGVNTMAVLDKNVNSNVASVQKKLNQLHITDSNGNSLSEDGMNGAHTKQAVRKFESIVGIGVDGIWGRQCESAYQQIVAKSTLQYGSNGKAVKYVQYRLGINYDGIYKSQTQRAVGRYEIRHGLHVDSGVVGKQIWNSLLG